MSAFNCRLQRTFRPLSASAGLIPRASELEGALADGFGEGWIGGNGGEPFGLGWALVTQKADQTQRLTLRSQLRTPDPSYLYVGWRVASGQECSLVWF